MKTLYLFELKLIKNDIIIIECWSVFVSMRVITLEKNIKLLNTNPWIKKAFKRH